MEKDGVQIVRAEWCRLPISRRVNLARRGGRLRKLTFVMSAQWEEPAVETRSVRSAQLIPCLTERRWCARVPRAFTMRLQHGLTVLKDTQGSILLNGRLGTVFRRTSTRAVSVRVVQIATGAVCSLSQGTSNYHQMHLCSRAISVLDFVAIFTMVITTQPLVVVTQRLCTLDVHLGTKDLFVRVAKIIFTQYIHVAHKCTLCATTTPMALIHVL